MQKNPKKKLEKRSLIHHAATLNTTSSTIAALIDNFRGKLQVVEAGEGRCVLCLALMWDGSWLGVTEMKADREGEYDYTAELKRLRFRMETLEARLASNKEYIKSFDRDIGPFEAKYDTLIKQISGTYEGAKGGHERGIQVLVSTPCRLCGFMTIDNSVLQMEEFGYHPAFKRPSDTFYGVPFKPK